MIEWLFDHQSVGHRGMSRGRPRDRTCARGPGPATSSMKTRHVSCCVLTGNTALVAEPTRLIQCSHGATFGKDCPYGVSPAAIYRTTA
jgi:hypothetical protein